MSELTGEFLAKWFDVQILFYSAEIEAEQKAELKEIAKQINERTHSTRSHRKD